MSLRTKTFLFGFFIILALLGIISFSSRQILLESFIALEEQTARRGSYPRIGGFKFRAEQFREFGKRLHSLG